MAINNDGVRMEASAQFSRRRMLQGSSAALAALGLLGTTGLSSPGVALADEGTPGLSASKSAPKPTIVLVHGAFADGSGWQHIIPLLEKDGYPVIAVQNPLTSITDDIATTKRVIDAEALKGPVVVVGHSYGGAVITGAADNPNVKALVYLAAFAPAAGEPVAAFLGTYPSLLGTALVPDAAGFLYIDRTKFREIFAKDVGRTEVSVMAATQKPISGQIFGQAPAVAAWSTIPSWFLVSTQDNAINPDLERFYANRMKATTSEIKASHVAFISQPEAITKLIKKAARAVS